MMNPETKSALQLQILHLKAKGAFDCHRPEPSSARHEAVCLQIQNASAESVKPFVKLA